MLIALGDNDRKAGLYVCLSSQNSNPKSLFYEDVKINEPKISEDGKVCFLIKQTSEECPNWYTFSRGKQPTKISNISMWYEGVGTELITAGQLDNRAVRGVLFKPLSFNPLKKYPVIINYYEEKTSEKNSFLYPSLISGDINIPWFVSRGYLVLQPDIYFEQGLSGKNALDFVNALADTLVNIKFVDSTKLGLMGHSFGGFETLFIITHNNRFKAAVAGAPIADLVSGANMLTPNGLFPDLTRYHIEKAQLRMGTTMWEKPALHILNSPIFQTDKVATPLLIMHNQSDRNVPFAQGMEFFLSMRRLGKPCWLLEYDGEAHTLNTEANKLDYTIRLTQFFDHFLKDLSAPFWMLEGQKYKNNNYGRGYELDKASRPLPKGINSADQQIRIDGYSQIPFKMKCLN